MKVVIGIIALLIMVPLSFAEETGPAQYDHAQLDRYLNHTHGYTDVDTDTNTQNPEARSEQGVGMDMKIYEFGDEAKLLDNITIEGKYDFISCNSAVYGVVKTDLTKMFKFLKGGKK